MSDAIAPPVHDGFTLERAYKASPARVFAAWASHDQKKKWFGVMEGWIEDINTMDFREGGEERTSGRFPNGMHSDFRNRYIEIIPDRRIVYAYEMFIDGRRISVSLASITLEPHGTGTKLTLIESGAYLVSFSPDGDDNLNRRQGTSDILDELARYLEG